MAWVGAIAIIGLLVIGLFELRDLRRRRKARKLPPGESLPASWWTPKRLALFSGAGVLVLVGAGFAADRLIGTTKQVKITTPPSTRSITTTTSSSTTTLPPGRPPTQVHVAVLNGSGAARAAATKGAALAAAGYQIVGTFNSTVRQGSIVECKSGFDAEAARLATTVGGGATVQLFQVPAPPGTQAADCIVILGR